MTDPNHSILHLPSIRKILRKNVCKFDATRALSVGGITKQETIIKPAWRLYYHLCRPMRRIIYLTIQKTMRVSKSVRILSLEVFS
jgi:hypothetical protein